MRSGSCSRLLSAAMLLASTPLVAARPVAAQEAPAPIDLRTLEGKWDLVAVLSNDKESLEARGALDIDWATAGAHFQTLFGDTNELHAEFFGAPLSSRNGVAGGSLTFLDPAKGTLQLTSKAPAPLLRTLESLDAGLLPNAFVLAEKKGEAQFVFMRAEIINEERDALVQQASQRADLQIATVAAR